MNKYDEIFAEGYNSFNAGGYLDENPYEIDSEENEWWMEGWEKSQIDSHPN